MGRPFRTFILRWCLRAVADLHGVRVSKGQERDAVRVLLDASREMDLLTFIRKLFELVEKLLPIILLLLNEGRKPDSIDGIGMLTKARGQVEQETSRAWEALK